MHEHVCQPSPDRVRFPGPFTYHEVLVEGWRVPFVEAHPKGENHVRLILDGRMGIDLSSQEAEKFLPFLADAISVALGYGAHPSAQMDRLPPPLPHAAPRRVFDAGLASGEAAA